MKNMPLTLFVGSCIGVLVSCNIFDKVDDLTDVTFDEELSLTFEVNETETGDNQLYTDVQTLDAETNSLVAQYKDKIKKVTVTKVTYTITDFSSVPPGTAVDFTNGKIKFSDVAQTTATIIASVDAVNLATTSGEKELALTTSDVTAVSALLLKDRKIKIYSEGTLSKTPVAFGVVVTLYVTIVANPL